MYKMDIFKAKFHNNLNLLCIKWRFLTRNFTITLMLNQNDGTE